MIIIVGLGNPGKKYEKTRHNIGFRIIDELAKKKTRNFIIAKPQGFMNNSGKAVKGLVNFYKIKLEDLWIIHDDIDLPIDKIRIAKGRGSAGHKGVESIIKELKTKDFNRLRIGIQPKTGKPKAVDKFVLQNFTKEEEKIIKGVVEETIQAIEHNINR
ncbi:Peptidyl-tRNA hydrolase [subsurface metagenome]